MSPPPPPSSLSLESSRHTHTHIYIHTYFPLPKPTVSFYLLCTYVCWCFLSCLFNDKRQQLMLKPNANKGILSTAPGICCTGNMYFISWSTSEVAEISLEIGVAVVGLVLPVNELPCVAGHLQQTAYTRFCLTCLQTLCRGAEEPPGRVKQ